MVNKKSDVVQELVNVYPPWSIIRTDEQSVGQQLLNTFATPLETLEKELIRLRDNQYLTTANVDEIDLTYKIDLGVSFSFDEDTSDPHFQVFSAPTVSGLIDSTWYDVSGVVQNDIKSFWYESFPNRISIGTIVSGENHSLLVSDASDLPVSGIWNHHLSGGDLWIETTGGVQYLSVDNNQVQRAKIILEGTTRKGTEEQETLIFPWDQKQKTLKEWKTLTNIQAFDMEDEVSVEIRSADFSSGPYMSFWNLKYSENRNKIDEFWTIGHSGSIPTLDKVLYEADEWQQLVLGFSTKSMVSQWELLEGTNNVISGMNITVSGVDMAIQPYTDTAWIVDGNNILRAYNLKEDTVSGIRYLKDSTAGAQVQLEYDDTGILLGENIEFSPWHARPIKEIQKYRIWYQQPDGQKFGLLDGSAVSFTSNFWVKIPSSTLITRVVESLISIPTTIRGEYLIVVEADFADGTSENFRRIFKTRYKTPEVEISLNEIIPDNVDGIDFDADQKMWIEANGAYYQINLHKDIMIIDYANKFMYFKEPYEEVRVTTND